MFLLIGLSLSAHATEAGATQANKKDITPADVFVHVQKVQAELELLRFHMGKPRYDDVKQSLNIYNAHLAKYSFRP